MAQLLPLTRNNLHLINDIAHESVTGIAALTQLIQSVQKRFDRHIELWYADSFATLFHRFDRHVVMHPLPGDDYQLYGIDVESANTTLYVLVPAEQRLLALTGS